MAVNVAKAILEAAGDAVEPLVVDPGADPGALVEACEEESKPAKKGSVENWDSIQARNIAAILDGTTTEIKARIKNLRSEKLETLIRTHHSLVEDMRLLQGKSTSNVAIVTRDQGISHIRGIAKRIKELEERMGIKTGAVEAIEEADACDGETEE